MNARSIAPAGPHPRLHRLFRILWVLLVLLFALLVLGGCVTKYELRMRGVQVDPNQTMPDDSALAVDKVPEIKKVDRDENLVS